MKEESAAVKRMLKVISVTSVRMAPLIFNKTTNMDAAEVCNCNNYGIYLARNTGTAILQ